MKGWRWGERFKCQERQQRCLNSEAKLCQGRDQLRHGSGSAQEQQLPLRRC